MNKWIAILFSGMLLFSAQTFGRTIPLTGQPVVQFDDLQNKIVYFMRRHDVPGASVAIMRNGKLLYARGYGWADVDKKQQVQPNSLFRIASMSKAITAATVIHLIQDHELTYQTKIFSVLNDLQPRPGMRLNPQIKNIAVVDVLRMLSGWQNAGYFGFDPIFGPWSNSYTKKLGANTPPSCAMAVEFMMGVPLKNAPGTNFSYSNVDYCLLGLLINKITNRPYGYQGYEEYVRSSILHPMGIEDMQIGSTSATLPNEVHYYGATNNNQFPYGHDGILHKAYSAAGWVATASDLVKFENGLMHMLNQESLNYILAMPPGIRYRKNYPTHYAMGWFISKRKHGGYAWVTHGSFTGTRSIMVKRPDGYVIAVIFNTEPWPQRRALANITYTLLNTKL